MEIVGFSFRGIFRLDCCVDGYVTFCWVNLMSANCTVGVLTNHSSFSLISSRPSINWSIFSGAKPKLRLLVMFWASTV